MQYENNKSAYQPARLDRSVWVLSGCKEESFSHEGALISIVVFVFSRYTEVANNVQSQETILNIQFVLLDCSPLKYAILSHCTEWQNKFTTLLSEIATSRLRELHEFLKDNAEK